MFLVTVLEVFPFQVYSMPHWSDCQEKENVDKFREFFLEFLLSPFIHGQSCTCYPCSFFLPREKHVLEKHHCSVAGGNAILWVEEWISREVHAPASVPITVLTKPRSTLETGHIVTPLLLQAIITVVDAVLETMTAHSLSVRGGSVPQTLSSA